MKRIAPLLAALVVAVSSFACSGGSSDQKAATSPGSLSTPVPAPKGILRFALDTEPEKLNPILSDLDPITDQLIFSGLTRYGKNFTPQPDLAERWSVSDDGLVYTFNLRPGVKWHDGAPLTAADVKFTYDTLTGPGVTTGKKILFEEVASTEAVDDQTVRITLRHPLNAFLGRASLGIAPKHLLEGKNVNEDRFNQHPVGSGPFKFVEWRPGEFTTVEANPDFYRGRPKLERIVVSFVEDAAARAVQLRAGEIDGTWLPPQLAGQFEGSKAVKLYTWTSHDGRDLTLNFYADNAKVFEDKLVRQAMNHAIDRQAVVQGVFHGRAVPAWSPFTVSRFPEAVGPEVTYDPAKVVDLMTQAGWRKDAAGIWEKAGQKAAFTITGPTTEPSRLDTGNVAATSLRANGFDVKVDARPWDYILAPENMKKIDAFAFGWGYYSDDPDEGTSSQLHSKALVDKPGGSYNYGYVRPEVDRLLDEARTEPSRDAQVAKYRELERIIQDDPPVLFVVFIEQPYAISAKVAGPEETTLAHHAFGLFWNISDWSIQS